MIIEWVQQCDRCEGYGIYVGFSERAGLGVVCYACEGTGRVKRCFEYDEFKGRGIKKDVTRVIQYNPGYTLKATVDKVGGIDYTDWLSGKAFGRGTEMREKTCPALWYQNVNYDLKPDWDGCGVGHIPSCKYFETKENCWEKWDKEQDEKVK